MVSRLQPSRSDLFLRLAQTLALSRSNMGEPRFYILQSALSPENHLPLLSCCSELHLRLRYLVHLRQLLDYRHLHSDFSHRRLRSRVDPDRGGHDRAPRRAQRSAVEHHVTDVLLYGMEQRDCDLRDHTDHIDPLERQHTADNRDYLLWQPFLACDEVSRSRLSVQVSSTCSICP